MISRPTLRLPYCLHRPHPRQAIFLCLSSILEVLFGGAAGGGKSDALLMAALQYVDVPGYAALILRRTFADLALPGAIMSRAKTWLLGQPGVHWNEQGKTFAFPSGATLTFGYLETEVDKYRYQSSEFQFIGFDELTQFAEADYTYMFSRLRRPIDVDDKAPLARVPLRMRAASNPGGRGHAWVYQRFMVEGRGKGRIFIPSKLADNPSLDATEYARALSELDPITRRQLLDGDWLARQDGGMFRREWFLGSAGVNICDARPPVASWVRRWDLAATEERMGADPDWTAGCLMGRDPDGILWIADMVHVRRSPKGVEDALRNTAAIDGREVAIRVEQEPGSSGVMLIEHLATKVLWGYDFAGVRSTGAKDLRARPLAAAAEAGRVRLVRGPWISDFLDEVEAFPQPGFHDDQVDAAAGGLTDLSNQYISGASGSIDSAASRSGSTSQGASPYHASRPRSLIGGR